MSHTISAYFKLGAKPKGLALKRGWASIMIGRRSTKVEPSPVNIHASLRTYLI
jgi:hypothetical protein